MTKNQINLDHLAFEQDVVRIQMEKKSLLKKVVSGSLLVAGTEIGAGMLALPLATAEAGFFPALIMYLVCWAFSLATGFLMLEITLSMPVGSNLISMASSYLGRFGKYLAWALYLFLFYCLTVAYIVGGSGMVNQFLFQGTGNLGSLLLFTTVFGLVVCLGTRVVDRVNFILMFGLIFAYMGFVFLGISHIQPDYLRRFEFQYAVGALPIIFTTFSYQGILPSLTDYLKQDRKALRLSIWFGASIPFFAYMVWDLLIKGMIPAVDLVEAREIGQTAAEPLRIWLKTPSVVWLGQSFSFFALTTSFLGVTLGLTDFLADGIGIDNRGKNRIFLAFLVYFPALLIAFINPRIFFKALEYAGGIGCILLLGLLPVLMVFVRRYVKKERLGHREVFGGRLMLFWLLVFILFEIGVTLS